MVINYQQYIETNPTIMFGKPCVKGTRLPVDMILGKLGDNYSIEDLLDAYPKLTKESILACLTYASFSLRNEEVLPLATA
jgi:uncharacterized protein (DUF433 family)